MAVVGLRILIPRQVQTQFVDDLGALADPVLPGLGGDVAVDPLADRALEGRPVELAPLLVGDFKAVRLG